MVELKRHSLLNTLTGVFLLTLTSESSELVCKSPHEVNERNSQKKRPRYLYKPQSEIYSRTNKSNENVVYSCRIQPNRAECSSSCCT